MDLNRCFLVPLGTTCGKNKELTPKTTTPHINLSQVIPPPANKKGKHLSEVLTLLKTGNNKK